MFIPLPVISLIVFLIFTVGSFLVGALVCENTKKSTVPWFVSIFLGIIAFFISCAWGLYELFF